MYNTNNNYVDYLPIERTVIASMDKQTPPLHKPEWLPSKKIFLVIVFLLVSIVAASTVVLANENRVTVQASTLNVRIGPGLSHDVMTQVQQNDRLNVLGEENEWYKVRLADDQIGWVASWLVTNDEVTTDTELFGRVTGSTVNIRQFATTDSDIIGTVYQDTELQILYQEGNWFQVLYMGRVAWIHGDYIELIDAATGNLASTETTESAQEVTIGETPVNIRSGPSADSEVITVAEPGQQFAYLNAENDWYEIQVNSETSAYVASWLVNLETVSTVDEEQAETQSARMVTDISEATIVIDAGHGGRDPGALSPNGDFNEKELTLRTAGLLSQRLQDAGANVHITREDDRFISLNDRVVLSHSANADAFISLHYDSVEAANSMSGTTTYYYSESERSFAETINTYLEEYGPLPNNDVRVGDFFVLRNNQQPSILLELGYLNNDHDITLVNTESYQSTIVEAIYQGLREHFAQ